MAEDYFPEQDKLTLRFKDRKLEQAFRVSYDKSVRVPLRMGIIISILSWYSAIPLVFFVIPEQLPWLGTLTFLYIGSYFGFIVYATYNDRFQGYYHLMGAISNAWAGLFTIYFGSFFPSDVHIVLPVIIFIIFFGSYMIRLRWMAGFLAALSYIVSYQVYIVAYADLSDGEIILYSFVSWMVLIFALLAGRTAENNYRIAYVQEETIREQNKIIEQEKELLLKEVHHRVQNNLQMIISLMNLQLRKLEDPEALQAAVKETRAALCRAQGRVFSMSLVHQRINQTSNFSRISLLEYADNLKNSVAARYPGTKVDIQLAIPDSIQFDIERAIPLGLILNEMMTGSCSAAGQEKQQHNVIILGEETDSRHFKIIYTDHQRTFPENHRESIEFELIDILTEQLDGTFSYSQEDGAKYELSI